MASDSNGRVGGDEPLTQLEELSRNLKAGERIVAPTRRPDGTLRKPIRIRAGYVPQDEVAIYQSKGALVRIFRFFIFNFLSVCVHFATFFPLPSCLVARKIRRNSKKKVHFFVPCVLSR